MIILTDHRLCWCLTGRYDLIKCESYLLICRKKNCKSIGKIKEKNCIENDFKIESNKTMSLSPFHVFRHSMNHCLEVDEDWLWMDYAGHGFVRVEAERVCNHHHCRRNFHDLARELWESLRERWKQPENEN